MSFTNKSSTSSSQQTRESSRELIFNFTESTQLATAILHARLWRDFGVWCAMTKGNLERKTADVEVALLPK